jgi:hypothetical protein
VAIILIVGETIIDLLIFVMMIMGIVIKILEIKIQFSIYSLADIRDQWSVIKKT